MKLLLLYFFGLLTFVSATALLSKLKRSHRLQWLKHSGNHHTVVSKNVEIHVVNNLPAASNIKDVNSVAATTISPTRRTSNYPPYYTITPGYTGPTSYPWYTPTRWGWGTTTSNPWYWTSPNWNSDPTTAYPWRTTRYWSTVVPTSTYNPWYTTTTANYWGTTTRNPNNMCPYGAISSMSKKQCFQLFYKTLTFIEAEMDCQSRNGHLASIHDAFDNMLLNDYARNMFGPSSQFFIGANDLTNKQWAWTDETQFDFVDWYSYQSGNEYNDCALVDTSHGAWLKSDCYSEAYYACVVPAYPY
uniref:C-type lectin domain-containing protein n=1 Tax=Panagrolaimus sp. ES5 TaxID=591445 RepID=A0AC34FKQ4_9BILA